MRRIAELMTVAVLSSVVAIAATNGLGLVSADGENQLIHGCVKQNGSLRITSDGGTCGINETAISWPSQTSTVAGYEVVVATQPVVSKVFASATAECPSGKVATGGGAEVLNAITIGGQEFWKVNSPVVVDGNAVGWAGAYYPSGAPEDAVLQVTVICVDAP